LSQYSSKRSAPGLWSCATYGSDKGEVAEYHYCKVHYYAWETVSVKSLELLSSKCCRISIWTL